MLLSVPCLVRCHDLEVMPQVFYEKHLENVLMQRFFVPVLLNGKILSKEEVGSAPFSLFPMLRSNCGCPKKSTILA